MRVDEATIRRQPTLTAQWSLVDDVPEAPTDNDNTSVHVYSRVALLTGRTHYHISPELGKRGVAQFLQRLLVYYPRKRLLVAHDWGEQHKGAPVEVVIQEADGRLLLKPQPAYSPELNPQERIWKWLSCAVAHNCWSASLRGQIEAIR